MSPIARQTWILTALAVAAFFGLRSLPDTQCAFLHADHQPVISQGVEFCGVNEEANFYSPKDLKFPVKLELEFADNRSSGNLRLIGEDGRPIPAYEVAVSHTRQVHLHLRQITGRKGYVHLHPTPNEDGTWHFELPTWFVEGNPGGRFQAYVDFVTRRSSQVQLAEATADGDVITFAAFGFHFGAEQADVWRHQGDLLTANLHRIPARSSEITVVDYTHPEGLETTIPLDPLLSPQENAQRLYQRYKKALRRAASLAETMAHSREDLLYADELATAIATARGREELKALGSELAGDGWVESSRQAAPSRGKGPTARPRKYLIEGHEVLVGRHPRQNEQLTRTLARPHDIWMHARQLPGAHVLVRSQGTSKEPPDQVLLAAAALAAASSSAASSARVAVDWTQARHVRKPSGSPAGFVIYSRERTILVDPAQAAALEALRRS